ncbi:MAG: tyrosine-type recombinase/integrase [Candidatus Nitrosocosmicus sp.]|nr:site-specific integrase [Candidatus Nitrosocosmicus sp.]
MKAISSSSSSTTSSISTTIRNYDRDFSTHQAYKKCLEKYHKHPAYRNFINSLKTYATKAGYSFNLAKYLSLDVNRNLSLDDILSKNVKTIESEIIEEIIRQQEDEKLSSASTALFLTAVNHFFSINDVIINRKKIKKFIGELSTKFEYRSYTIDEINRLLSICDERDKVIVLLMASTGMRVGGLVDLRLRNLKKWIIDSRGNNYVYKIEVYASSTKDRYYTFCTPETAKAIDTYLDLRKRCGENIKQDPETGNWTPGEIPLIIKQFDKTGYFHAIKTIRPHSVNAKVIVPKLHKLGIRERVTVTEGSVLQSKGKRATIRHEIHPCHSFRIFAVTQMQRAKLDKTIREMLVGHSTGLDTVYYKPQDEEILQEYLKAVDLLTISNENRLQKQVDYYKERENDLSRMSVELAEIREKLGL